MKLGAFAPRFLLESVEGGERLARYSFIGFGDALEVRLDGAGLRIGAERRPPPADGAELLAALRAALSLAPKPQPDIAGVPLAGGLVGYAGYDVVRYFERLPAPAGDAGRVPLLHYVAPRSVLVFDHLTRGIALLHAGTEAERQALRAQVVRALRGALPNGRRAGRYAPPVAAFPRADYMAGVRRTQQYIAAGDVYQLVLAGRFPGRHDLGRVAEAGTVRVAPYRAIERYSHVMHIVSGVHGELAAGRDAFDLFAAAFPAGTLVGAPKVRAMQIIDELEPVGRGLYGGTVGYFGARGDMGHAITIRTLVFSGDEYSYQAGAGIVAD